MPGYSSEEWSAVKGQKAFPTSERHMVDIWVSCSKTVSVFGVSETETVLLKAGQEFRFRGQVKGYKKIKIQGTGMTEYGLKVVHGPLMASEPNSGEKPPVIPLAEPSNLVLKMRQIARAHHEHSRMPVMDPDDFGLSRYEVPDDDDVLFEEEAWQKAQDDRKKAAREAKEAKARKEAEATGDGEQETATSRKPPEKAEKAPPSAKPDEGARTPPVSE